MASRHQGIEGKKKAFGIRSEPGPPRRARRNARAANDRARGSQGRRLPVSLQAIVSNSKVGNPGLGCQRGPAFGALAMRCSAQIVAAGDTAAFSRTQAAPAGNDERQ